MPENYPDPWTDSTEKFGAGTVADAIGDGSSSRGGKGPLRDPNSGRFVTRDVEPAFENESDDTGRKPTIPGL